MTAWAWIGIAYGAGAIATGLFNVGTLILSGGMVTRPGIILRNAILWPIMLPVLILDWLKNS